jgi:hypothetical protein
MNTKQTRLTTTASTRENTNTTRKKNTTLKTQIIKDIKQEEKVKRAILAKCSVFPLLFGAEHSQSLETALPNADRITRRWIFSI